MESASGLRDGSVLFLRNTLENAFIFHLWRMRTDQGTGKLLEEPRQLTHDTYDLSEISSSADGEEVVAVRGVNSHPNLYVADLPPASQYPRFNNVRRLTFTDTDEYPHSWTPDSQSVIFESHRNGHFDLFRQRIDQTDAQPLVISNDTKALARLSPDGKWVLYNEQLPSRRWKVMRIPLAGGTPETVVPDAAIGGEYNCALLPAGRCVLRTVQNDQFVFWDLDPCAWQRTRTGENRLDPGRNRRLGHLPGRIANRRPQSRSSRRQDTAGAARRARWHGREDGDRQGSQESVRRRLGR
jgi:hypothetical protein